MFYFILFIIIPPTGLIAFSDRITAYDLRSTLPHALVCSLMRLLLIMWITLLCQSIALGDAAGRDEAPADGGEGAPCGLGDVLPLGSLLVNVSENQAAINAAVESLCGRSAGGGEEEEAGRRCLGGALAAVLQLLSLEQSVAERAVAARAADSGQGAEEAAAR